MTVHCATCQLPLKNGERHIPADCIRALLRDNTRYREEATRWRLKYETSQRELREARNALARRPAPMGFGALRREGR